MLHFSSPTIYHKAVEEEKFETACHESKKTHFSRDVNTSRSVSHDLLKPTFDYHRRIDHPPSPSQDDRFSPRIVARLKAVGFIRAKGNVAYDGEKAFSWGGKGVVSCQVCDVFLISFIDATGIRVSG